MDEEKRRRSMRPTPRLARRRCVRRLLLCLPALALLGGASGAQEKSQPSFLSQQETLPSRLDGFSFAAPRPTFAGALAALEQPKQDLFLTVGADKVTLPPDATPADPSDRPGAVGEAYGRMARDFGGVTALAPPPMAVLNTRPGVPDPYDGMPAAEAFKVLAAGLNPVQWAALTGPNGLGLSDLDAAQRGLFRAVLPTGDVQGYPQGRSFIPTPAWQSVTLTARDMDGARLRWGRQMEMDVSVVGQAGTSGSYRPFSVPGESGYDANFAPVAHRETVYGAVLRETLTNSPKDADLDYEAPALKQSLRADGILTVGDLVARVGRAAGLELYADRRYETLPVTLLGRRTARAVDLLRATAFCVTGTFRRVGPAYVLTDDLEGTATRRQRLVRFAQQAEIMRHAAVEKAGDDLATARGGMDGMPWLGGLGFSEAQKALPQFTDSLWGAMTVSFAQLTPAQQEFVLDQARQVAAGSNRLDMSGRFMLRTAPHLLLLSPTAPGPFFLEYLNPVQFLQPSINFQMEEIRRQAVAAAKKGPAAAPPPAAPPPPAAAPPPAAPPRLVSLLRSYPRRAFLAAPRTAAELDRVLSGMKALGLNQLWLEVFVGGHPRLDLLTEALARTRGTGISVIPTLDPLRWGKDAPAEARDLTTLGETSGQAEAWEARYYNSVMNASNVGYRPPAVVWACPASPVVEGTLTALVRHLAATPGVTTLALRGTVPPGYNDPPRPITDGTELGYVPAQRLAFLRRDHVDPLDLDVNYPLAGADLTLPDFGSSYATGSAPQDWVRLRDAASRDLLRHLLAAAQEAGGGRFRFLVQQRGQAEAGWYGLWEDPQAPLPQVPAVLPGRDPAPPLSERDYAPAARSQCRINLYALPAWAASFPDLRAGDTDMLPSLKPGWDGMVLEADTDQLAALARTVKR